MPKSYFAFLLLMAWGHRALIAEPVLLDDQFTLPPGFHIYKAADASLTGGTYDITFDGQGRLLVGDGNAVRRLTDTDDDQVYDQYEVIARGLGGRGPQGLLVYGDKLYAVGGDGIQLFSGYESGGPLQHEGRLGQPFNTGGDHAAHTVLRGLDGYIYFVCGDGGGVADRKHITEESSPVMYERNGSVFRFDPDGEYWECISAGGRNAPSLGMNYLGEFFSFDSDMEWHVDLPWYRPVRLNHWAIGGDQGWQGVGAYPPYFIDNLPPVLEVGRGSPNWGVFYEHTQFPEKYSDAFLCCDYRWKSATSGGYNSSGRLVAFHLSRDGATWKATMDTLAEAKPKAVDAEGKEINFALVDVDVAPDGSIFVSDHNQGVWRIFYSKEGRIPEVTPGLHGGRTFPYLPQPSSEWTRLREQSEIRRLGGLDDLSEEGSAGFLFRSIAESKESHIRVRLHAIRVLAPKFKTLDRRFLDRLASDGEVEIRAQVAWLYGLRRNGNEAPVLIRLLADGDPFVRRRAVEALGRLNSASANQALVRALGDAERPVRYAAMTAIAHQPLREWIDMAMESDSPQVWMRALVAGSIRREAPSQQWVGDFVGRLLETNLTSLEDRLDFLRVLGLFQDQVHENADLLPRIHEYVLAGLEGTDSDLLWEHTRLAGDYSIAAAIDPLLGRLLDSDTTEVTRFHIAQALSRIQDGWSSGQSRHLFEWLVTTQQGWFAEFEGKGRQFPQFWATVLDRLVDQHAGVVEDFAPQLRPGSQLSSMAYGVLATRDSGIRKLTELFEQADAGTRREIVGALAGSRIDESLWPVMLDELSKADRESRMLLAEWIERQRAEVSRYSAYLDDIDVDGLKGEQGIAERLLSLLEEGRDGAARGDRALRTLFGRVSNETDFRREEARLATQESWQAWYRERYGVPYVPPAGEAARQQLTDEAIHDLLLAAGESGNAAGGRKIYLQASCFSCHGGLVDQQAAVFGPDLAGATKRLKATELADAIVYPSKQVAERFRNSMVVTKDGQTLTGVLTEKTAQDLVLVDAENKVSRVPMANVEALRTLETSPMPGQLLNRFNAEQVQDLLAFLRGLN